MKSLTKYVIFSIAMLIVFTICMVVLFCIYQTIPETLVTCFFACFGGEVLTCGLIKIFKLKRE